MLDGFQHRWFLLDVSRGVVPSLSELIGAVDHLHEAGFTGIVIYGELHSLVVPGYEDVSAGYPALTLADLGHLDAHCAKRHMELIPAIQSLGHMDHLLARPACVDLAYDPAERWSIDPRNPRALALLDAYYGAVTQAIRAPYIHVCLDEPADIIPTTRLSHAVAVGYIPGEIPPADNAALLLYVRHVSRLAGMVASRGRKMMMWGDVLLHHPQLLALIPRHIIPVHWWYEGDAGCHALDVLSTYGHKAWVCSAVHAHETGVADVPRALANAHSMAVAGHQTGCEGAILAHWNDAGKATLDAAWTVVNALRQPYEAVPALDRDVRHRTYHALTGVYDRAGVVERELAAHGDLGDVARAAQRDEKRSYVALNSLRQVTG